MTKQFLIAAIIGLALVTSSAYSQDLGGKPGSYTVTGDDSLLLLMPELKTAGPPKWLKPGMRLTWYSASATIPGSYIGGLTQQANGQWRDPTTGRTFRSDDAASASGHGYQVLDVVAVHDDVVVVAYGMSLIQGVDGPLTPSMSGAYSTPSSYLSGFWVNPQVLARHTNLAGAGIQAARVQYQLGGRQYDAYWSTIKSANSSSSSVSDLASGLVLHSGLASESAPSVVNLNGVATNVGGGTNLAQTTFRGMRQLEIPWAGAPLPAVIANVRKLVYEGTTTINVPGTFPASFRYTAENVITGRGKDFLQTKWTTVIDYGNGMPPSVTPSESVTSCNQFTPLAIPPESLARLRQGDVLDRDPVTKGTVTVAFVGRDRRGNDIVVLRNSQGEGQYREDSIYDRTTGILAGVVRKDPSTYTQTQVVLTGKE